MLSRFKCFRVRVNRSPGTTQCVMWGSGTLTHLPIATTAISGSEIIEFLSHPSNGRSNAGLCLFDRATADRDQGLLEYGPFWCYCRCRRAYEIRRSVIRPNSAVAQIANTTPARIRLAVCRDESAFACERSALSCSISAPSISSPHGGGIRLFLLVECFIVQAGAIRLPLAPVFLRSKRGRSVWEQSTRSEVRSQAGVVLMRCQH